MTAQLIPLILPQKVEHERRMSAMQRSSYAADSELADNSSTWNLHNSSSSSDIASPSPLTPNFSRTCHSRFSGSVSSLELGTTSSSVAESPGSPVPHAKKGSKSHLPDVQEDPLEREDEDRTVLADRASLYDCLCDGNCNHQADVVHSATFYPYLSKDVDYDLGFLSDGYFNGSPRQKKRSCSKTSNSNWSARFKLAFWNSSSKSINLVLTSPVSDPSLGFGSTTARAASSRTSSISAPSRRMPDRTREPPLPETPACSIYKGQLSETITLALDLDDAQVRNSLERDRSMATTPLLPPLLTPLSYPSSQMPSPLQSPSVAHSSNPEGASPYPTPPLSTKASVSSFRRVPSNAAEALLPSPMSDFLDNHDAWSDRLGHANFTISPKPYLPELIGADWPAAFYKDWNEARVNYARHLARTGEHYGVTSITYKFTQAKWDEIEREWQLIEDRVVDHVCASGQEEALAGLPVRRVAEDTMLAAHKFPHRGDVDIVGPMVRDEVMVREYDRKNSTSAWFKSLSDKLGIRR